MSNSLDARGLACPAPVLMAKKALDDGAVGTLSILVDNEASMENVSRFLSSQSAGVDVVREGPDFKITAEIPEGGDSKSSQGDLPAIATENEGSGVKESGNKKIMVLAATDRIGFGDDDLGKKLMISFIKTIEEMGDELWRLVFVNNGVKLCINGSEVLETLQQYETDGLKIMVCGTCLTHFDLMKEKRVGETTNMLDIVTAMQLADKVIQF